MLNLTKLIPPMTMILAGFLTITAALAAEGDPTGDYRKLAQLLSPPVAESTDFIPLTSYAQGYDKSVYDACRDYLDNNPNLVERIRQDLECRNISWRLEELSHRLVYAPERRESVAGLFADYCREAVEDLLNRTGLANPYSSISTLFEEIPNLAGEQGINAYIVHNLAQDYMVRYAFSGDSKKRIELDLAGRIALNEVGSYSSYLHYSEEARSWEFVHDKHTVWKSASNNPYTVLMTPLEETLHIALRQHTEKAIRQAVISRPRTPSLTEIRKIVDDWLVVEEAIVGGLVYKLVPDIVIKRVPDLPMEWVRADLETKSRFDKYRLLPNAIEVVEKIGLKESIRRYSQDPVAFRKLLSAPG